MLSSALATICCLMLWSQDWQGVKGFKVREEEAIQVHDRAAGPNTKQEAGEQHIHTHSK